MISVKDLAPDMEASNQEFLTVSNIEAVVRRASLMIACAIMRAAYLELDHSVSMMIADYFAAVNSRSVCPFYMSRTEVREPATSGSEKPHRKAYSTDSEFGNLSAAAFLSEIICSIC